MSYDPVSSAALLRANDVSYGVKAVPDYHFDKAKVIVGIQADFLGTWISPVEYAKDYIKTRKVEDAHHASISRHYQIETYMSLTGSNADNQGSGQTIGDRSEHRVPAQCRCRENRWKHG